MNFNLNLTCLLFSCEFYFPCFPCNDLCIVPFTKAIHCIDCILRGARNIWNNLFLKIQPKTIMILMLGLFFELSSSFPDMGLREALAFFSMQQNNDCDKSSRSPKDTLNYLEIYKPLLSTEFCHLVK